MTIYDLIDKNEIDEIISLAKEFCVHKLDISGGSILGYVIKKRNFKLLIELLKYADPNSFDIELRTPLHYAYLYNSPLAVEILLENGAHPYVRDTLGNYPHDYCKFSEKILNYFKKTYNFE